MNYFYESKIQAVFNDLKKRCYGLALSRTPRLVFVGRRGAGKTTLLSAIFGLRIGRIGSVEPEINHISWNTHQSLNGKRIDVLDTRGFQSTTPGVDSVALDPLEVIFEAVITKKPDIFLFLIKAKEVDSAINGDIEGLSRLILLTQGYYKKPPSVIVVITQCDELDPPHIISVSDRLNYPEDWIEKQRNIYIAVETIKGHLKKHSEIFPHIIGFIPVSAYIRIRGDGTIDSDPRFDHRWNVNELSEILINSFPTETKVSSAILS